MPNKDNPAAIGCFATSFVVSVQLVASACSPPATSHTVQYYETHAEERKQRIDECANDPGTLRNDPSCINAQRAGFSDAMGSLRNRPPIKGLMEDADRQVRERTKR
jgi:hypothetical protein